MGDQRRQRKPTTALALMMSADPKGHNNGAKRKQEKTKRSEEGSE